MQRGQDIQGEPMKKIERRTFTVSDVETRTAEDGTLRLSGYGAVFNESSVPLPFKETIAPGAFRKTLSETPDVRLLVNHEGLPLARTKNGTLTLSEDSKGLHFEAVLADTQEARDIHALVTRGDIDQMSFAFRVIRQSWSEDRSMRTLTEVSLADGDVSVVTYPAYPTTSVEARAKLLAELDEVRTSPDADVAATQAAFEKARSAIAELIALEAAELGLGEDEQCSLNLLMEAANALLAWRACEDWENAEPVAPLDAMQPVDGVMEMDSAPRKISLRLAQAINA